MVPLGRLALLAPLDRKAPLDLLGQLAPKATREIVGFKDQRAIALSDPRASLEPRESAALTAHLAPKARRGMSARLDSPDPPVRWGLVDFKGFAAIWGPRGATALKASKVPQANAALKGFKASLGSVATQALKARRARFPRAQ